MPKDGPDLDPLLAPFLARAAREPDRPALLGPAGGALTHGGLLAAAREAAAHLAGRAGGAGGGALLALSAPPGPGFVVTLVAARLAGLTVALLDHQGPPTSREETARRLRAGWLWEPESGPPTALDGGAALDPRELRGAAVVKLTSGSTGRPKGVLVSSAALVADGEQIASALGIAGSDRALCVLPLSHSYGLSVLVLPLLLSGVPLVFPGDEPPLDVARRMGATFLPSVPAWFRVVLPLTRPADWRGSLRLLLTAGAPLPAALAREIRAHTGLAPRVLYGATEVGGITLDRTGGAAERGTVGTPLPGVEVELEPAAPGPGRIVVRSRAAGLGPWPPEREDPLAGGAFRAADTGEWQDGELALRGRVDAFLNVRGKKVDPARVERELVALPGVLEAAVLGVELPRGRGLAVRAVLALERGAQLSAVDVLRAASARLAAHEVPRGVVFVDELPRTMRGKLDRAALATLAAGAAARP